MQRAARERHDEGVLPPHTPDLFEALEAGASDPAPDARLALAPGAVVLRGYARVHAAALLADLEAVLDAAPLRHMVTPGGFTMSVAMSNCGALGWVSSAAGYRYDPIDPQSGRRWPLPASFASLACAAARAAGFDAFEPDACLINRYLPGARLTLHQDRNERAYGAPIVSVSLGVPALFLFGGNRRAERVQRVPLGHGDVVVWGGPARLRFHGVAALKPGAHPMLGACRINLTLRRAG